jgi:2-polyprenyl-3-methyl-5-hydroxy-6-metoxy-1,4-benzoquinol methylase
MKQAAEQVDKAGHDYWDSTWENTPVPASFDPYDKSLGNTFYFRVHEYFEKFIAGRKNIKVLEIGCAHSVWPEYFYKYHGIAVDGLDYSEAGCQKTQVMWDQKGLVGKIICADMFAPPPTMIGHYDIVMSFGVVEHFKDTTGCLSACASFLKPSGQLFTMIPNMAGFVGFLQKCIDKDIYDIHVPLTRDGLARAHQQAGLEVEDARYFMGLNLDIINSGRHAGKAVDKILRRALSVPSKCMWIVERSGVRMPANGFTSPCILTIARTK